MIDFFGKIKVIKKSNINMYKIIKLWDKNSYNDEVIATSDNKAELYSIMHKDMSETIHEQYGHCIHYMDFGEYETFRDEYIENDKLIETYNKFMDRRIRVYYIDYIKYKIMEF